MSLHQEGKLREPICRWLQSQGMHPVFEVYLMHGLCDVIGVQFEPKVARKRPEIKRVCSIELKLNDCAGVISQTKRNKCMIAESYAAMPQARVDRMKPATIEKFRAAGVGLISIGDVARVVIQPAPIEIDVSWFHERLPIKLWRRREEWASRLEVQS